MHITTRKTTRMTYTASKQLSTVPLASNSDRGIYYRPDCDRDAYSEASSMFNGIAEALRAKAKAPDNPVSMHITQSGGSLFAEFALTVTKTE